MKNFPPFYIFTFKKMINFLQENCALSKIIRLGGMVFGEGGEEFLKKTYIIENLFVIIKFD